MSGGALGAAVYASLTPDTIEHLPACDFDASSSRSVEKQATAILGQEILTPLLAGVLFSDFFSSVLPFTVPALDRARVFDAAIEQLLVGSPAEGRLSLPVRQSWRPNGMAPAIIANTYDLSGLGPLGIAPFNLNTSIVRDFYTSAADYSGQPFEATYPEDLRVSTAVGLSSRFPIVTPEGTYTRTVLYSKPGAASFGPPTSENTIRRTNVLRMVDGGYFDNEGSAGIRGLLTSIKYTNERHLCPPGVRSTPFEPCRARPFQVYLFQITGAPDVATEAHIYGSFATPMAGIMSIRGAWKQAMNDILVEDIYNTWGHFPCGRPRASIYLETTIFRPFDPDQGMFYLPLSRQLSHTTDGMIDTLLPNGALCHAQTQGGDPIPLGNHCSLWDLRWALESQNSGEECPYN